MPNVASVLKEEIRRLARKEARSQAVPLRKALNIERKKVAALRKQVASLVRSNGRVAQAAVAAKPVSGQGAAAPKNWRKDTVRSTRKQLGLTQAQLAKLLGVSQISVSFWETGRSTPRPKAQAKVLDARKLSKAQARSRLGLDAAAGGRGSGRRVARRVAHKAGPRSRGRASARARKA